MLWKNGQVQGEWILGWRGQCLSAWSEVPAADSLLGRHAAPWVVEALGRVTAAFGAAPRWEILGEASPRRAPSWESAASLLVFTHAFDRGSPVCRGESRHGVPLYALPLSPAERENLLFWAGEYRHTDSLWLASGALEKAAYRQLADPSSPLMREGRRLAGHLEERTDRPTYLFVLRYHGRIRGEARRPCPSCGGVWGRRPGRGPLAAIGEFRGRTLIPRAGSREVPRRRPR